MTDRETNTPPKEIWIDTASETERGPNWPTKPVWAADRYIHEDAAQVDKDLAVAQALQRAADVAAALRDQVDDTFRRETADAIRGAILAIMTPEQRAALDGETNTTATYAPKDV